MPATRDHSARNTHIRRKTCRFAQMAQISTIHPENRLWIRTCYAHQIILKIAARRIARANANYSLFCGYFRRGSVPNQCGFWLAAHDSDRQNFHIFHMHLCKTLGFWDANSTWVIHMALPEITENETKWNSHNRNKNAKMCITHCSCISGYAGRNR